MSYDFQTVAVIGLGYVGLPTAALLASRNIRVIGVDSNPDVVSMVNSGRVHIVEADLDGLVQKVVQNGYLSARLDPLPADVFLIAVPTPIKADKSPDLSYVVAATHAIAPMLERGNLVILESTSPIGTTEALCNIISELRPDLTVPTQAGVSCDISVAYCPERVLPGRTLTELVTNDRSIGGITPRCARHGQRFYKIFVRGTCYRTTARTAELVKLCENSFRDTNIGFANELSVICDRFGINVWEVIELANRHPRVNILRPGPGVGGHCVAVDPWFLVHSAPDLARIVRTAREVNDAKASYTVGKCVQTIERSGGGLIACLGIAFKANVDDLRESPALQVAAELSSLYESRLRIVEPNIKELPQVLAKCGVELIDLDTALATCSVVLLLVDHDEFKMLSISELASVIVYDTRGIWQTNKHENA
jgi:UDP-N-acetyl-D-mannosaminuronic acid dehydrogenase